jgi:hypothetical protein
MLLRWIPGLVDLVIVVSRAETSERIYEDITVENTNSTTNFAQISETMENDCDVTVVTITSRLFSLRW